MHSQPGFFAPIMAGMRALHARWPFLVLGVLFLAIYLITAIRQANEINLSVTAGGQYPYFQNAERMASEGVLNYMGDRNRMPLIPSLLSLLHEEDRHAFFGRGKMFAMVSSLIALICLCLAFFATLPRWPAMFMAALAAVHVFLPKASFVQAELAFYTFSFLSWLALCAVLQRCEIKWAIAAGIATAFAYYSKASATPMLVLFIAVIIIRLMGSLSRAPVIPPLPLGEGRGEGLGGVTKNPVVEPYRASFSIWRCPLCAGTAAVLFLLLACPYLLDNKEQFGRYFYNVNSTFYMWLDSWQEAQQFAAQYNINAQFPAIEAEHIPSLIKYVRTHSIAQMARRMQYGVGALAQLTICSPYWKYFVIASVALTILIVRDWRPSLALLREYWAAVLFTALMVVTYAAAYSWYAVVSYGDRFILSLYLPVVFVLVWGCVNLSRGKSLGIDDRPRRWTEIGALVLLAVLLIEGAVMAVSRVPRPTPHFAEFYFNESREAFLAGDKEAALEGYRGVIRLEPRFAPAHHELAIVALQSGRPQDAADPARAAAEIEPVNPNYLNTYGSALVQLGKARDAVDILQKAVLADPEFSSAWYNLGLAFAMAGNFEDARQVAQELNRIDPQAARRLSEVLDRR